MAYISSEEVKTIRERIKSAYPSYMWSITREHGSTIRVALMASDLTFSSGYIQVNHYYVKEHYADNPKAKEVFSNVLKIIHGYKLCYDRNAGDPYADYGSNNYFINLHVGKWDKPHVTRQAQKIPDIIVI